MAAQLSFGDDVKNQATQMLHALMAYANNEIPQCPIQLDVQWKVENNRYQLVVKNAHQEKHLLKLVKVFCQRNKIDLVCTSKKNIQANFFNVLRSGTLNMLKDENNLSQKKRTGLWCFSIPLWSDKTEDNLKQFSQYWQKQYNENKKEKKQPKLKRYSKDKNPNEDNKSKEKTSLSQEISDLLFLLNCIQQENAFKAARATANPAGTFLVRAKDLSLQKWLVNRLVRLVPGYENAYCQPFNVYSPQIRLNFNILWENLAANLNTTATLDNVTQALVERCCRQTVILVLYGVHKLKSDRIAQFMQFWQQLVQGIQVQRERNFRSRLILFLVEDTEEHKYPFDWVQTIDSQCLEIPLRLSPLSQISKAEALTWLSLDEVYEKLTQILSQEQIDLLLQDISVNDPDINANEVLISLDEICLTCGLENGIAEVEQYWKLSA